MSLYWPLQEADVVTNAPRLHALVIGVGDYDHLGLGVPQPSRLLSGLPPLTITNPAARRIARWLEAEYHNPDCPLGSIELLLGPAETMARKDGSQVAIEKSTMAAVIGAIDRWFQRCDTDIGSIAFFYFAGHGISTVSQFLLPADFGKPGIDDWRNCIDFTGLKAGMIKCKADKQFFFVDACRDKPNSVLAQHNPHGDPVVGGSSTSDQVEVSAAYFAASNGLKAYGKDGDETYFCKALITSLNGAAARLPRPWAVQAMSLEFALKSVMNEMAVATNVPLSCDANDAQKPAKLHYPTGGTVVVRVSCRDRQASAESAIKVTQGPDVLTSAVGESRPWLETVRAEQTQIEVSFTSFPPHRVNEGLIPPTYPLEI